MNTDYRLLIDYDALLYIESVPKRDARAIRGRLVDISKYPDHFSDCQESDLKERLLDVHIFGKYAKKKAIQKRLIEGLTL